MKNRWFLSEGIRPSPSRALCSLLVFSGVVALSPVGKASAPEWLRTASHIALPHYPEETNAVLILNEQVTSVTDKGEIKTEHRRAYKILRPEGREHGMVAVYFDSETRLTYLKGWSIASDGTQHEVKEMDAVEASVAGAGVLYQDTRFKLLKIPGAEPGSVIGYEYEQKRRPNVLQDTWEFQEEIPTKHASFVLRLPKEWEYNVVWLNHPPQDPQSSGENQWTWELEDLPAIEPEPAMPHWRALAGRLAVTYLAGQGSGEKSNASWRDVGLWYSHLTASRRQPSPDIQQKVAQLTSSLPTPWGKVRALASFVQKDIRYVGIEIGIGGYQPHEAQEVFANRYGDCKDKVTLLSTMLGAIGVDSYYVLINTQRGVVAPNFPSILNFNHVILAIRVPANAPVENLYAVRKDPALRPLLFFDPTDPLTPLGYLPPSLQGNRGLVVRDDGGDLVELPLLPPPTNRLSRTAKVSLNFVGGVVAEVQEVREGAPAEYLRAQLLIGPTADRTKVLERFLGMFLGGFTLQESSVENLESSDEPLVLHYRFLAQNYGKPAGNLLLLRPRVLGEKGSGLLEKKERKYPVEFPTTMLDSDVFDISLPSGYQVDELPAPTEAHCSAADYNSKSEVIGGTLRYTRNYTLKDVLVPKERLEELKNFYRQIAADESASAVLKRTEVK